MTWDSIPGGLSPTRPARANADIPSMARYLLKRLLLIVPTLFGIMLLNFIIVQLGDGLLHRTARRRR